MQRLQVEQGNGSVQRLVSALTEQSKDGETAPPVQRAGHDVKINSLLRLDVRTYTKTWAAQIAGDLDKQMAQATLAASNPFITWGDVTGQQFIAAAMKPVTTAGMDLWDVLTSTLAPTSPEAAVNRGRDADDTGMSPMEYKPAVAQELRILYTRQLNESVARILPRYVAAKSQKLLEEEWKANSSRLPSANTNQTSTAIPSVLVLKTVPDEPSQDDVAVSHPFDRLVTKALVTGLAIVDVAAYRKSKPSDATAGRARLVGFDVEVNTGPMAWVRVGSANATAEDVAHTVYGDAALAYSVTAAPPLFGVDPQKVSKEHWPKFRAAPRTGFAAGDTTGFGPTDAAMAAPQHDEAAVNQAMNLPLVSMSKDEVVQRMRMTLLHLDDLAETAKTFKLEQKIAPLRAKIDARSIALQAAADPYEGMKWDAQSAAQLDVVIKATTGLRVAAEQYTAMQTPSETGRVDPVPGYVEVPLRQVAEAYVDAAAASDLVVTGNAKLSVADERSKTYPIDVMEGVLAYLRSILTGPKNLFVAYTSKAPGGWGPEDSYGISPMLDQEAKLRSRLVTVREMLVSSPEKVPEEIQKIQVEMNDLQTDAMIIGHLDAVAGLIREAWSHYQSEPSKAERDPNVAYKKINARLTEWNARLHEIHREFRTGDREKAREQLKTFLADGRFVGALELAAAGIEHQARKDAIEKLIFKIGAMVGIAVATMGVGTLVEGGLVGSAGRRRGSAAPPRSAPRWWCPRPRRPASRSFLDNCSKAIRTAARSWSS